MMLLWFSHLAVTSRAERLTSATPGNQHREQLGPCASLKESHVTQASGAQQLSSNAEELTIFLRTPVGNLHSALSMWLPAADHLTLLSRFWKSPLLPSTLPPPYPRTSSEAVHEETRITLRLAECVERKNMDILFSCAASVTL